MQTSNNMPYERNLRVQKDDYERMRSTTFREKVPFDTISESVNKLENIMCENV